MDLTSILSLVFVIAVGVAVGTDVTVMQLKNVFNNGVKPFACGLLAQFFFMPLYVLVLSHVFANFLEENAQHNLSSAVLGLTVVGCLPGSGTSNLFTYFVGGNLPLSILMSLVSSFAALGFMPLMLFLLYDLRFGDSKTAVDIPYVNIVVPLLLTCLAVIVGMALKQNASYNVTWWVAKSCTIFSIVFLFLTIVVGLAKYHEILTQGDLAFFICTLSIQPAGYGAGMLFARLLRVGLRDQMTIAFETGVQSFSTGMALAQLSFDPDESQIAEDIFVDVFKFSAVCGLFYSVHAAWLILLFRKLLPGGIHRVAANYIQEDWPGYFHVQHSAEDCFSTAKRKPNAHASSIASLDQLPPMILPYVFERAAERCSAKIALAVERPVPQKGADGKAPSLPFEQWTKWTYAEYFAEVQTAAKALIQLGTPAFGSVTIWGFNAPEWAIGCMATIFAGAKVVGIYPTDTAEQVCYKTVHSGAVVALVGDSGKMKKCVEHASEMPTLKAITVWGDNDAALTEAKVPVHTWAEFLGFGSDTMLTTKLQARIAAQEPGHCAVLVYTSGTTGKPKAVMLSHDNFVFASWTYGHVNRDINGLYWGEQMRQLSYLPLSHVAGLFVDVIFPLWSSGTTKGHYTIFFARPYDLKDSTIGARLQLVKPTFFVGVPRVWEKMAEKLKAIGKNTTGWFCCFRKRAVAAWAKGQGLATAKELQYGRSGRTSMFYGLAEAMVLSPIKNALGLDECRMHVSAAAPISTDTLQYFGSLGITINEVFAMSETTAVGTMSVDRRFRWGSCGFAAPGTQVRIIRPDGGGEAPRCSDVLDPTEEEQGEICFRGRHVMMGYMANQNLGAEHVSETLKQTCASIDNEGWLHSGDKGCMTQDGMFRVTGRFKELIIGAGGENVSPVPMENKIKEICPALSNVMMVGDKRKFNTCLVTLQAVGATGELPGNDDLFGAALEVSEGVKVVSAAMQDPKWQTYVENGIRKANGDATACPNNASKIQAFRILPRDFSVHTGELTPTLKLKRSVAAEIWAAKIDEMYPP